MSADPLAPQPMTGDEVADMVERTRLASAGRDKLSLENLPDAYAAAQFIASELAIHRDTPPRNTCRYCDGFWRPFTGTRFGGHVQCVVDEEFKIKLAALLDSPHVNVRTVAAMLDVTPAVVRAWWLWVRDGKQPAAVEQRVRTGTGDHPLAHMLTPIVSAEMINGCAHILVRGRLPSRSTRARENRARGSERKPCTCTVCGQTGHNNKNPKCPGRQP